LSVREALCPGTSYEVVPIAPSSYDVPPSVATGVISVHLRTVMRMVQGVPDAIRSVPPFLAYAIIALLVFGEAAFFVRFVVPGETPPDAGEEEASGPAE
jgi:hypothetical protein